MNNGLVARALEVNLTLMPSSGCCRGSLIRATKV